MRPGRLGVSFVGFLVTLAVLLLFLFVVLEFVNRWTRIPAPATTPPGLKSSLDNAARALSRDLEAAGAGRLPPEAAIRPAGDNALPGQAYVDFKGETFLVRPGTDRLGIRGALRSPLLALEPSDRATGLRFSSGAGEAGAGAIQPDPARVPLKIYPRGASGRGDADLAAVVARLKARPLEGPRKRFFVTGSVAGPWAVARILSFRDRTTGSPEGCAPPPDGCHLEVALDFTDADAILKNPDPGREAWRGLGVLAWGGLFDDVVYFVAEGTKGAPPDYFSVNDPPSLAHPHPFLALAESAGSGRWDVVTVAEDVENLQVAWCVAGASGETWRADRTGAPPLAADELGRGGLRLRAVRTAVVAKAAQRRLTPQGTEIPEDALPFNAPAPAAGASPIGWAEEARRRIAFDRETRYVLFRVGGAR